MRKEINAILLANKPSDDFDLLTIPNGCHMCGSELGDITPELLEKIYQAGYKEGSKKTGVTQSFRQTLDHNLESFVYSFMIAYPIHKDFVKSEKETEFEQKRVEDFQVWLYSKLTDKEE